MVSSKKIFGKIGTKIPKNNKKIKKNLHIGNIQKKQKQEVRIMTLKEFAERLNGTEYNGYPIFSKEDIGIAKENGFVIVTGASDDLMEFEGAIEDEAGCFDGGRVYISKNGVEEDKTKNVINALWCDAEDENGVVIPWAYETKIPHETFYVIDAGEVYCRGIVFNLEDVA